MSCFLILADLTTVTVAVRAGFFIWHFINPSIPPLNPLLLLVSGCCVAEFAYSGQYPGIGLTAVEHMRRTFRGTTLVYLLLTAAMFLTKDSLADSRGGLFLSWFFSLVFVTTGRWLTFHTIGSRPWWGVPVIVLGAGTTARAVIRNLNANRVLGYRPVACVDDNPAVEQVCEGVPVLGSFLDAGPVAARYGVQHAILIPTMDRKQLVSNLRRWRRMFPKILIVPDLAGVSTLWTESRDLGGLLALEMRQNLLNRWNQQVKRFVDIVAAGLGLIVAAPILAACAVWIKAVSPGRAFYTQKREGKEGNLIHILKLRTMHADAEKSLTQYLDQNPDAKEEWNRFCKLKRDPRILPGVGHFLRKTSLDELPQLWNVLKGEMSLVGPRPFPVYHNARFDPEFRDVRTQVTPGLTGLWQISARSDGDLTVQETLDSYYIRNWSPWLDLYILIRTVRAVISPQGSY